MVSISDARQQPTTQQVEAELASEILRIHVGSYGNGAGEARAVVAGDWVIVVLDGLELLPNEEILVANGNAESVKHVRTKFQLAIRSSFSAAVERATGRSVVGFASATSVEEPRFAAEIFKLR